LEFRSILEPVRRLQPDRFHQGWADDVDFTNKTIRVETNPDADEINSRTLPPATQSSPHNDGRDSGSSDLSVIQTPFSGSVKETLTKRKGEMITVPYDKLILAVGAYSQTFGIPGVREHANFLRDVGDARSIRLRILQCFERAELPSTTDEQRRKLLHFAVVGGGPTGIEFAAELHDLIHDDLARIYPDLMPLVGITVYDIAPKILPMFDKKLSSYTIDSFRRQGIHIKTQHHIKSIRPDEDGKGGLKIKIQEYDDEVSAGIVVWSTGLMQNPLVARLVEQNIRAPVTPEEEQTWHIVKAERSGGLVVDDHLRVRVSTGSTRAIDSQSGRSAPSDILPEVYAMGDCAVLEREALPATAQVASQQAKYLAKALNKYGSCEAVGNKSKPFVFLNLGTIAYIGSWRAIAQTFGNLPLHMDFSYDYPDMSSDLIQPLDKNHCGIVMENMYDDKLRVVDDTKPRSWIWWGSICHRLPPDLDISQTGPMSHGGPDGSWADTCRVGEARHCDSWPGSFPAKCRIGAMGWLLSCRQNYAEAIEILYSTNTIIMTNEAMIAHLPQLLLPQRLASITSLQISWNLKSRYESGFWNVIDEADLKHTCGIISTQFPQLRRLYLSLERSRHLGSCWGSDAWPTISLHLDNLARMMPSLTEHAISLPDIPFDSILYDAKETDFGSYSEICHSYNQIWRSTDGEMDVIRLPHVDSYPRAPYHIDTSTSKGKGYWILNGSNWPEKEKVIIGSPPV
ncbi:NADH dehydrogenase, partial [Fusarium acutatum]